MTTLTEYVDSWRASCVDLAALADELAPGDWALPTDCAGWTVHDVLAHCTAIEAELAGDLRPRVLVDVELAHIAGPSNIYTERGVMALRDHTPDQLRAEFAAAVDRRTAHLEAAFPAEPEGRPALTPGDIDWDWQTLMRNRAIDIWVHEQDIRRAVGKAGHLDSVGARTTQEAFASGLPYIVAKRSAAPPGSTVVFDITGPLPAVYGVEVGDDGRGRALAPPPEEPTVRLIMTTEELVLLGAGRRDPETLGVTVSGDQDLGNRILTNMTLTM